MVLNLLRIIQFIKKLTTSNSVYKKFLAPFQQNNKVNYNLDAADKSTSPKSSPNASATTSEIPNTKREGGVGINFGIQEIGIQTDFFKFGEQRNISVNGKSELRGLNEIGKALVVLHEGAHADYERQAGGDQSNDAEHDILAAGGANSYRSDIQKGLQEYNDANNLGLSKNNIEDLSYYSLQGTDSFNEHFKLDSKAGDYADKQKAVIDRLDLLIYTEKK